MAHNERTNTMICRLLDLSPQEHKASRTGLITITDAYDGLNKTLLCDNSPNVIVEMAIQRQPWKS